MIITKLQVAPVELDVSSQLSSTCRASRVRRVEPVKRVELVVSSESSCAVRLARHSQNAWARHVEHVESCRVESSQVKFELKQYCTIKRYKSVTDAVRGGRRIFMHRP